MPTRQPSLEPVRAHYEARLTQFGATAKGVDWRDDETQERRFRQFDRLCIRGDVRSVCDLGCGFGAFLVHLRTHGFTGEYSGVDVSPEMISAATTQHEADQSASFSVGDTPTDADVVVASGTFNVALAANRTDWDRYVWHTIEAMWARARVGIGFNLLSMRSDRDRRADHLFYSEPDHMLRRVQDELTPHVELNHAYGLYEYTVLATQEPLA